VKEGRLRVALNSSESGYTLMELLVVITILLALSGVAISGVRSVMNKAYLTESKVELIRLVTAIEAYYHDNGVYPDISGSGAYYDAQKDGDQAVVMDGLSNGSQELVKLLIDDKTGVTYLSLTQAKSANLMENSLVSYAYRDRWGNPYEVYWDANYDGMVSNPLDPTEKLNKGVIGIGFGRSASLPHSTQGVVKSW